MHKLDQAILHQNRSHEICLINGVMIFTDVTRECSSAAGHLDENAKAYPLFISCVLPVHMIFVIVDSKVKFLKNDS